MKKLIFTLIVSMLAIHLPAPVMSEPQPILTIGFSFITTNADTSNVGVTTNGATVTASGVWPGRKQILQVSTDLTTTNWINLQTNPPLGGIIFFTNVPATNPCEYFRTVYAN